MEETVFFFGSWQSLLRVLVVGVLGYATLAMLLRASGKRTLASMNAFDFVITIAVGSVYGRVITAKGVPVSDAVAAFILLVAMQLLVSWLKLRSKRFHRYLTAPPTLLLYRGQYLYKPMRRERVTRDEVEAAVRQNGFGSTDEVEAVVLENSGTLSVIARTNTGNASALPPTP